MKLSELLVALLDALVDKETEFRQAVCERSASLRLEDPKRPGSKKLDDSESHISEPDREILSRLTRGDLLLADLDRESRRLLGPYWAVAEAEVLDKDPARWTIFRVWHLVTARLCAMFQLSFDDREGRDADFKARLRAYVADVELHALARPNDFSAEIARLDGEGVSEELLELIWRVEPAEATRLALPRPEPAAERLMTDGQKRLWEALQGRALTGKELARALDTSEETVRQWVKELRAAGHEIENRRGRGYFRPDAPPSEAGGHT
jgi:biotin operon repressor